MLLPGRNAIDSGLGPGSDIQQMRVAGEED